MTELSSDSRKLLQLGDYLIDALPSEVRPSTIIEVERLLNEMYKKATRDNYSRQIQATISAAIGEASYLSHLVRRDDPRSPTFFSTLKDLGSNLLLLSDLLS